MLPLTKDIQVQLNSFMAGEGSKVIEDLGKVLWDYYSTQCTLSEGNELYREQGAAQLAKWLMNLPKGLRDGRNTYSTNN